MGEQINSNVKALRFEFDLRKSLNNLRLIANSTLNRKNITKLEMEEGFLNTSLTRKEANAIRQKFKRISDGILRINPREKIQINYIKVFSALWYDFLRIKNPSTIIEQKSLKRKRSGITFPPKAKKKRRLKQINEIKLSVVIAIIIVLVFFGALYSKTSQILVEKYDLVTLDYRMWQSDTARGYDSLNPLIDETIVVEVIPRTEQDDGLILGLYNNIIGKAQYYESGLIWLAKCVDQNRDGIDDNSGEPALSYGNSTDQYFGMYLMIQFKILNIL